MEAEERIRKARIRLLYKYPFFGYLVMRLRLRKMPEDSPMKTVGVNYKGDLFYDDDFVNGKTDDELIAILVHEVLHLILEHLLRMGERDLKCGNEGTTLDLWGLACDIAVNKIMDECGINLPDGSVKDEHFKLDAKNKCAEEIYEWLREHLKTKEEPKGGYDYHGYGKGEDGKSALDEAKGEWKKAMVDASTLARQQGNLPSGIERIVDGMLTPKQGWKERMWRFITHTIASDYTYSRPHKKSVACGFYMPSVKKDDIDLIVAVDTSGSIGKEELEEFMAECRSIAGSFSNIKMTVIVCDAEITGVFDITDVESGTIKLRGGGGTDFRPVFDWIEENVANPKALIYLTDGYGTYPEEPSYCVIWALLNEYETPFGEKVMIKEV